MLKFLFYDDEIATGEIESGMASGMCSIHVLDIRL